MFQCFPLRTSPTFCFSDKIYKCRVKLIIMFKSLEIRDLFFSEYSPKKFID